MAAVIAPHAAVLPKASGKLRAQCPQPRTPTAADRGIWPKSLGLLSTRPTMKFSTRKGFRRPS